MPDDRRTLPANLGLAELHAHVGSASDPAVMWSIAHAQGINVWRFAEGRGLRVPRRDFASFRDLVTVNPRRDTSFEAYLALFDLTELIQSSPEAIELTVKEIVGGACRKNGIELLELRFNPMKRNRQGERDLDHIIAAAIRGMERAMLEYPVRAGLIFCLDKSYEPALNAIIVDRAIRYRAVAYPDGLPARAGVVGVDIAGHEPPGFRFADLAPLFDRAREYGLGVTVHAGESGSLDAMKEAVRTLRPHRVGHGVKAAWDAEFLDELRACGVHLEVCPTSNLNTRVLASERELRWVLSQLLEHQVSFSINTDGPEMLRRGLRAEYNWLLRRQLLTPEQARQCVAWAQAATFVQ